MRPLAGPAQYLSLRRRKRAPRWSLSLTRRCSSSSGQCVLSASGGVRRSAPPRMPVQPPHTRRLRLMRTRVSASSRRLSWDSSLDRAISSSTGRALLRLLRRDDAVSPRPRGLARPCQYLRRPAPVEVTGGPRPRESRECLEGVEKEGAGGEGHKRGRRPPKRIEPEAVHVLAHDLSVVAHEHDEHHERWSKNAIEHRGPEEHPDRIQVEEIEHERADQGQGHDQIEAGRAPEGLIEARSPAIELGHGEGGRAHEDRNGEKARAENADGEEEVRAVAGERPQRLRGLASGLDASHVSPMQGGRRGEDDEVHHEIGKEHANADIEPGVLELVRGRALPLAQRDEALGFHLLDLVRGLPKEEIGRDGRAEDAHEGHEPLAIPVHGGDDRGPQYLLPVGRREERGDDIGEESNGEPLEILREARVAGVDRRQEDGHSHDGHHQVGGKTEKHLDGLTHPGEIGGDVEGVGDEQEEARDLEEAVAIAATHGGHETNAGDEPDAGADELDRGHQGKGGARCPQEGSADAGARHGVRRDSARVVVGRSGDQSGPEDAKIPDERIVAVSARLPRRAAPPTTKTLANRLERRPASTPTWHVAPVNGGWPRHHEYHSKWSASP